jgi:hypothetical protein
MREFAFLTDGDARVEEAARAQPRPGPIERPSPPTITASIVWLASAPSRRSASLRPREAGLAALTGRRRARDRRLRDGRAVLNLVRGRRDPMRHQAMTPSITVTIGRHTRLYFAFVTTAPADLDSPSTVTLHAAAFSDVAGFAADPITCDESRARTPARLVLVDAVELAWQRARYRGHQHLLLPADRVLVGLNTLQHWLWQRLQASTTSEVPV